MILHDFYTIVTKNKIDETSFSSTITINEKHDIFNGHFPQNPVVPGVCLLQIVKDLVEDKLQTPVQLKNIANVKFTAIVNPTQNPNLDIKINIEKTETKTYKVNSIISSKEVVFLKIINAIYFNN